MTLYFENSVSFRDSCISTSATWHSTAPLLAVASYSQEKGGFAMIFDGMGQPLPDLNYPYHNLSQITALAWHPEKLILACGWENGELRMWNGIDKDFVNVGGPHRAPINLLEFSEKGGRLVTCDSSGSLVGWKVDTNTGETVTVYHHAFKETITHLTFLRTVKRHPDYDLEGLAKAAVNGDERALDVFSNWRPKTTARKVRATIGNDNQSFYVGTRGGSIFYLNHGGDCVEVLNTEGVPLNYIVHHPTREAIVVMMEGLTVGYFAIDGRGNLAEISKVKLSGRSISSSALSQELVWAGSNCLAILTGDLIIRIWNIDTNDNYIMPVAIPTHANETQPTHTEIFTCLAYSDMNRTLCAGTNVGRVYFWRRKKSEADAESPEDDCWELANSNVISGTVKQLIWGSAHLRLPLLCVNCVTGVYVMREQTMCASFSERVWATQKSAFSLLLDTEGSNYLLKLDVQVADMSINGNCLAVTNGRVVSFYDIIWKNTAKFELNSALSKLNADNSELSVNFNSSFPCENEAIEIHGKHVVALSAKGVMIKTSKGVTVGNIPTIPSEGEPIGMHINRNYLTVFTLEGFLKLYELTDQEPKQATPARNLYDLCNNFGEIIQAKSNCDGTKIALTAAASNLIPDGKLYVWNVEREAMLVYDFHKYGDYDVEGFVDVGDHGGEKGEGSGRGVYDEVCLNRVPVGLEWDGDDPRLLVCNAKRLKVVRRSASDDKVPRTESSQQQLKNEDHVIVTMFVSSEHGIRIQDVKAIDIEDRLLAVCTPYIALLHKLSVVRVLMTDFEGLENSNKSTRTAVLDFSYNLSLGNMDGAFKAIKLVQSPGVWGSLAKMCVKTRRLDVAGVCLGHMGNARAARALRLAVADVTLPQEAKLAVLAVQLGMFDEAEQLYVECGRYDLLNKLLQSRNKMEDAYKLAETKDRIHLRNTDHAWARSLEEEGKFKEAAFHYERANTHRQDVPRMLIDRPEQLALYMAKTSDRGLLKWWGQYVESQGDMNGALKIYASAGDLYAQVRVLCFLGEEAKAAELARSGNDKAAYYHMARHYEATENIQEAVAFFSRANAYSNAVRLCKENHMADELWNIAQAAGAREKLECAKYFEDIGVSDKAVLLYYRGGQLHKALDSAFKTQHYDVLLQIATDLDTSSDPVLIDKCAEYFIKNEQYDKAVDLLAIGHKYKEAIDICLQHNVQLTDDLTEKLTPEKGSIGEEIRLGILRTLAESLMLQGNYHLATKKYTQSGDKIQAMKALLKSGDTEKIVFFAGVSRQKEIYIMAANYLQSLDWQNQPEILRNIITFYSKGKALDLLANFYMACAQVEIDEFQNYEKAFGAITEASRCLAKVTSPRDMNVHQRAVEIVQQRLTDIKKFIDIRRLFERGDIESGITQCRQLLLTGGPKLEDSVRRGDVFAVMIQNCIKKNDFVEAKKVFDELQQFLTGMTTSITYYVGKEMVEALARGLNVATVALVPSVPKVNSLISDDGGEIEEVLNEE